MNLNAALANAVANTRVIPDYIQLQGGLDEIAPPYRRKPGRARAASNFQALIEGGYRRTAGYERLDGRTKPSTADYGVIYFTLSGSIAIGDTVTGGTSAATGVVLTSTAAYLVLTKITGIFQNGEALKVGGVTQGTSSSVLSLGGAATPLLDATYKNMAADLYRADIGAVPGSGNILGVIEYLDVVYAFRNNAGATATALYKSSTSGWTAVALGEQVSFTSGGVTEIVEGNTITGATSGATAVITRVVLTSGTWAAGTAAGKFIFASHTGAFVAENLNVGASPNLATIAANATAITLLPGGRYEFVKENFGGGATTQRVYGCDGVNKGFEFDGAVYVPIDTGMTTDAPSHVTAHHYQLFFSFFGSVQHSAPGTPYVWDAIVGASEIAVGDTVTGFSVQPGSGDGGALAIFTRNRLNVLYGSGVIDWQLSPYRDKLGAYANTIQDVGYTMFLDDNGITDLQTSQKYGNFAHNAISNQIKNTVNSLKRSAVSSCVSKDRGEYRIFFSTGDAIYVTTAGRSVIGIMPLTFPDIAYCAWAGERANGDEAIYFGSAGGYVYQMEKGTSFDGDPIASSIDLAYNFQGSPRVNKHYRACTAEVEGGGYAAFSLGYRLGYGLTEIPQPVSQSVVTNFSSAYWDSFIWDAFTWDGTTLSPSTVTIDGDAENISLAITSSSDIYEPFTFTSLMLNYTTRGRLRP